MSDTESKPNPEEVHACPQCGTELTKNAPGGLCPRCLMAKAMMPTEEPGKASRPEPPALEEVQAAFPQLEILEVIGVGGMGVVYKAKQTSLNRLVALKLLAPHREQEAGFSERFTREAQALAALNHPNIVTVHDFGQEGGFYYLLMEYVDGVNLRQAIKTERFTPEQALAIVPSICEALQFAHDRGIVHRDIKPENLLLDKEGRIKVADFGIARILNLAETETDEDSEVASDPGLTAGTVLGTPNYMAPEQADHPELVDHRADIYSLGVVFYEMLTGEPPSGSLSPPSSKVKLDVRLDEIVLKALADSPELRWQSATDLQTQVETIANTDAPPPLSNFAPPTEKPESALSSEASQKQSTPTSQPHRGNGALWVGIGLSVLAVPLILISIAVLFAVGNDPDWNPAVSEAVFAFGTWAATLAVFVGAVLSLGAWFRRQTSSIRRTAGIVAGVCTLLLVLITAPFVTWAFLGIKRAQSLEEEARAMHRQAMTEAADEALRARLNAERERLETLTDPNDLISTEAIIKELNKELVKIDRGSSDLPGQPSYTSTSAHTAGFSFILLILVGVAGIGFAILVLFLLAKASKGLAIGCGVLMLVAVIFVAVGLLYINLKRTVVDNAHHSDQSHRIASVPTSDDVATATIRQISATESPGNPDSTEVNLIVDTLHQAPGWRFWIVITEIKFAKSGPGTTGESHRKLGSDGRSRLDLTGVKMGKRSREEFSQSLQSNLGRPLEIKPTDRVKLFQFTAENGKRIVGTLELRPEPDWSSGPLPQIYVRDMKTNTQEGWVAFSWSDVASVEGVDLILETHGASVRLDWLSEIDLSRFPDSTDVAGPGFSRRKLEGGGAVRFDFPVADASTYSVTAMGTRLSLGVGDSHRLFEITDSTTQHKAWAELRSVATGSTQEVIPEKESKSPDTGSSPEPAKSFPTNR